MAALTAVPPALRGRLLNLAERVNNRNNEMISARALLLDLFAAGVRNSLSSHEIKRTGQAFGLSELALRTALTRLRAEGKLCAVARGVYTCGAIEDPIRERAAMWWKYPARRIIWDGSWIGAAIKPTSLPRTAWRRTQWALEFNGFRQESAGLWVRPNNLAGGVGQMAPDLVAFGAAQALMVFRMDGIAPRHAGRLGGLWDLDALAREHEQTIGTLQRSLASLDEADSAAVETLLVGRQAIRLILRDPLLPSEISGDVSPDRLVEMMMAYDRVGREAWARFMDTISAAGH